MYFMTFDDLRRNVLGQLNRRICSGPFMCEFFLYQLQGRVGHLKKMQTILMVKCIGLFATPYLIASLAICLAQHTILSALKRTFELSTCTQNNKLNKIPHKTSQHHN
jgi:hypothetical protein